MKGLFKNFFVKQSAVIAIGLCIYVSAYSTLHAEDENGNLDQRTVIREHLVEGRQLFIEGKYDDALAEFQKVIDLKPNHLGARIAIKTILDEKKRLTDLKRDNAVEKRMLNTEEMIKDPLPTTVVNNLKSDNGQIVEGQKTEKRIELEKKLNKRIPEINFTNAHLRDVIHYLHTVGDVNIILDEAIFQNEVTDVLSMPSSIEVTNQETDDQYAGEEEADQTIPVPVIPQDQLTDRVTIALQDIPLIEALKYILRTKKLRYRIDDYAVWISKDIIAPEMLTRSYKLLGGKLSINKLTFDKPNNEGPAPGARIEEVVNIKRVIQETVPFPPGSKIFLDNRSNTLVVTNTKENHDLITEIVERLSVPPLQVEITTRFVEIGQLDSEELGLELFIADGAGTSFDGLRIDSNNTDPTFGQDTTANLEGITSGLRFLETTVGGTTVPAGNILAVGGILGDSDYQAVLHALNQRSNVDVLNAPKVTTLNGHQAEIKIVTEFWYPQEFDVVPPVLDGTGTEIVPAAVEASDFIRRDIGVLLTVTPDIGGNHKTINLTVVPEVSEFQEWMDFGITNAPQLVPIFTSDSLATSVVINDNETIVLGGTVSTRRVVTEDKIPVLGDIPFFGKAFRSEAEVDEKVNLLIFITARIITPNGNALQDEIQQARAEQN
ncbi:hypothetical protein KDK77_08660 [bacterium]|nr:hypothetical protein [bacterium]MCP5463171.1 hypothetical protein [bacterium]